MAGVPLDGRPDRLARINGQFDDGSGRAFRRIQGGMPGPLPVVTCITPPQVTAHHFSRPPVKEKPAWCRIIPISEFAGEPFGSAPPRIVLSSPRPDEPEKREANYGEA
jgi:hypothetical protein